MMRRTCYFAAFYALTLVLALATDSAAVEQKPKIEVNPMIVDLGTISDDDQGRAKFTIKNTGNAELVIIDAKPSCGCTVANLSSRKVAPGESSTLETVYNAHGASGQIQKFITLKSNDADPARQTLNLSIKAVVVPKPAPSIKLSIMELPGLNIPKGGSEKRTVQVTNDGQEELVINEMTTSNGMTVKFADIEVAASSTKKTDLRLKPGETGNMEVTISPVAQSGSYIDSVIIRSNAKKLPAARFRAQGMVN